MPRHPHSRGEAAISVAEIPSNDVDFERTPPHDIAAEQCALGGMLLSKDAIADVIEVLRAGDFYRPAHQLIYDTVLDLYGRGEPADAVTVAADLTRRSELTRVGGAPYLHTLISSVPTAANAGYYARIVRERAVLRRLVEAGTRIVQLGYGGQGSEIDDVVDQAQAEVYAVTEQRTGEDYLRLDEVMPGALDEIEAISSRGGSTGVPTGFADLDSVTNGLHPGQLAVVAARPAIGKALALDTPLPTPDGWTTMGQVQVGDQLLAADGTPTTVVAATGVMEDRPCYEVTFDDGTSVIADAEHQWLTDTRASRRGFDTRALDQGAANQADASQGRSPKAHRVCASRARTPRDAAWAPRAQQFLVSEPLESAQAVTAAYTRTRNQRTFAAVRTTREIAETVRCSTADQRLNHSVSNAQELETPERDLPLPPYVLGAWLGDGHSNAARITTCDPEIVMCMEGAGLVLTSITSMTYSIRLPASIPSERTCVVCGARFFPQTSQVRTCGRSCGGRARFVSDPVPEPTCPDCGRPSSGCLRCQECAWHHGSVQAILRSLGVLGNKHIPTAYLRASIEQRRALLAGLLDTDGTVIKTGAVQFSVTNARLAEDFRELVVSLGYRCSVSTKQVRGRSTASSTAYTVTFTTSDDVFGLERKRIPHKERNAGSHPRTRSRFITSVRPVPSVPVRCVEVDHQDHLYLATRSMIPTHNSTLGLDFVRAATVSHGLPSVIFSLEMSRNEITMRLLSAEAQIPLHTMRSGTMTDDDWTRLARYMSEVAEAPLFIDDSPNMSMMEIRAKCRRLKQRHDLRLVIVDYLQLMSAARKVDNRQQEVAEFSRALKLLAKELEVPVVAIAQLNRGAEQRTDKKPMLSDLRECLTGDTLITRIDTGERVAIRDLTGQRDIPVWTLDEHLRLRRGTMTEAWRTGVRQVYRLTLASGRQITATANHPLLTVHGWTPIDALDVDDHLAIARNIPEPAQTGRWGDDHVMLLAHLLGDGCTNRSPVYYCSRDEVNLRVVEDTATRIFGVETSRTAGRGVTYVHFPVTGSAARGRTSPLYDWLREIGLYGKRAPEKRVPAAVHTLGDDQIRLFLRHLWATDGSVTTASSTGRVRVYYATTSRELADDVQALLLRLGIGARLRHHTTKGAHRQGWTVDVSGRDDLLTFLTTVGVHGERGERCQEALDHLDGGRGNPNADAIPAGAWDYVRKAMEPAGVTTRALAEHLGMSYCGSTLYKCGLSRARMTRVTDAVPDPYLEDLAASDVRWDRIVSIEPAGEVEVFDAHVPDTHSFLANDVISHNSGAIEQDADVVLLLHREDAYEKESPRAGEADLILAKHRNGPTTTVTVTSQLHYSRFRDMAHM